MSSINDPAQITHEVIERMSEEVNFFAFQAAIRAGLQTFPSEGGRVPGLVALMYGFEHEGREAWSIYCTLCPNCDEPHFIMVDIRSGEAWEWPKELVTAIADGEGALEELVATVMMRLFQGRN